MSDNDNVVRPDAFQPHLTEEQEFVLSVAGLQGTIADHMESGKVTAIGVFVDREDLVFPEVMYVSMDDDVRPLLTGATVLKAVIEHMIDTTVEDVPPPSPKAS